MTERRVTRLGDEYLWRIEQLGYPWWDVFHLGPQRWAKAPDAEWSVEFREPVAAIARMEEMNRWDREREARRQNRWRRIG